MKKIFNIPNTLTGARILLATIFFGLMVLGKKAADFHDLGSYNYYLLALAVFVAAGLTDLLDGYYARKLGQVTVLGRIIDPFADKLMICGTFVVILSIDDRLVDVWLVLVVLSREFMVSAIRAVAESHNIPFGAMGLGKVKMAMQFSAGITFIVALYLDGARAVAPDAGGCAAALDFLWRAWFAAGLPIVRTMYWVSMIVTIVSGVTYLKKGIEAIGQIERGRP